MTPIPFPVRPIVEMPEDRLAHATRDVLSAIHDVEFELAAAFNARDQRRLAEIVDVLGECVEGLMVATSMAKDFGQRLEGRK